MNIEQYRYVLPLAISSLLLVFGNAQAVSLSKGQTFEIKEPNLLTEIKQKAEQVDWQALSNNMKLVRSQVRLPVAKENHTYYYKPTTKLPFEVKDKEGNIIYPSGFEFNPLQYVTLPNQLIVLGSPSHLDFLNTLSLLVNPDDTLLIANMDTPLFIKKSQRHAFVLTQEAGTRLGVKRVPAIIKQVGDQLFIQEFVPSKVAQP